MLSLKDLISRISPQSGSNNGSKSSDSAKNTNKSANKNTAMDRDKMTNEIFNYISTRPGRFNVRTSDLSSSEYGKNPAAEWVQTVKVEWLPTFMDVYLNPPSLLDSQDWDRDIRVLLAAWAQKDQARVMSKVYGLLKDPKTRQKGLAAIETIGSPDCLKSLKPLVQKVDKLPEEDVRALVGAVASCDKTSSELLRQMRASAPEKMLRVHKRLEQHLADRRN
jgi:hypothetical protein